MHAKATLLAENGVIRLNENAFVRLDLRATGPITVKSVAIQVIEYSTCKHGKRLSESYNERRKLATIHKPGTKKTHCFCLIIYGFCFSIEKIGFQCDHTKALSVKILTFLILFLTTLTFLYICIVQNTVSNHHIRRRTHR